MWKRHKLVYGKRVVIITRNGNTLYQIHNNNPSNSLQYLKMIQTSWLCRQICKKEKKENKKTNNKPKNLNKKEINL